MSEEENKRIVRRLVEEFQSGHKFEVGEELTADDFIDRTPGPGESGNKKDGLEFFKYIWEAFPDFSVEIKEQIAEGDRVATLKTFSGTHKGEFIGIPPTGKHVAFDVFDMLRIRDGKLVEHWNVVDMAGMWQQLGAMPPPDA